MLEIEVSARTREDALARVRDAVAAIGAEERFTFASTTGTEHTPSGRRAPNPEDQPDGESESSAP
jgi:hypothetical protein